MIARAAAVAVGGVALVLVALTFEAAILFVPGLALVLIAVLSVAWLWLASRGARVKREIHGERVVEGQPLEATIEVRHGWFGLPGCAVLDPLVGSPMTLRLWPPDLRRRGTQVRVVARFERRGRRVLAVPSLSVCDPLGMLRLTRRGRGSDEEVLVLPRTERPKALEGGLAVPMGSDPGAAVLEPVAAIEVDGLRPYRHGTPASRIHWLAYARGAGLLERRLRPDTADGPLVVLDARCPVEDERLDKAVRAAASLARELARLGGCELLLPGERRTIEIEPDLGAWPAAHARLALVSGGPDTPLPVLTPRPGRIFYVAADLGHHPMRVLEQLSAAVLVVPREVAGAPRHVPSFTVSGCVGLVVGSTGTGTPRVGRRAA